MTEPSSGAPAAGGEAGDDFTLEVLPLPNASRIDGLKLIEGPRGPTLLVSQQICRSPRLGMNDCQMEISALSPGTPAQVQPVVRLPRLLPPAPRWDARATVEGHYEILFEEAGGALNKLLVHEPTGRVTSPSAAHPYQSFSSPRFVRAPTEAGTRDIGATLDSKTLVLFPKASAGTPSSLLPLGAASDGVVGRAVAPWIVTKTNVGGEALFDQLPGRLALAWLRGFDDATPSATVAFPGLLFFQFDAATAGNDVVVFATGRPAALLLSSRPARPIFLSSADRGWLRSLAQPTISVGMLHLRVAALANPLTPEARVLYGEFPLSRLGGK